MNTFPKIAMSIIPLEWYRWPKFQGLVHGPRGSYASVWFSLYFGNIVYVQAITVGSLNTKYQHTHCQDKYILAPFSTQSTFEYEVVSHTLLISQV